MLIDSLIYGCARLTGGASARSSRRLIETCLAAGIRHFDTAPSYGLGTAEAVLGSVLTDRSDIRVTVKLGSARPRWGRLLTYARALKGAARPRVSPLRDDFVPASPAAAGDAPLLSPEGMRRSLDHSRRALRRDRFDLLLLHEITPDRIDQRHIDLLEEERRDGRAEAVGWSTGAVVDRSLLDRTPAGWLCQASVRPEMLSGGADRGEPLYLHSVANVTLFRQRTDAGFGRWMTSAADLIPEAVADRRTAAIAAVYARLHAVSPDRGLLFASIDPHRLRAFLTAIGHIDAHVGVAAFAR